MLNIFRILNDDMPGTFEFEQRGYFVKESCGEAVLTILRENGADGEVWCYLVSLLCALSLVVLCAT